MIAHFELWPPLRIQAPQWNDKKRSGVPVAQSLVCKASVCKIMKWRFTARPFSRENNTACPEPDLKLAGRVAGESLGDFRQEIEKGQWRKGRMIVSARTVAEPLIVPAYLNECFVQSLWTRAAHI